MNRFGRAGLCAVLTNDIVMNSGTFDADDQYTPAAGETAREMNPIGSEKQPYTGTFDGGGYAIRGLCASKRGSYNSSGEGVAEGNYAGLFGKLSGATVKNLTVTGYVDGRFYVGGIAGYADDATKTLNCRNECIVVSGRSTFTGDTESVIQYAGGIVGYNAGSVTACCNAGAVTGIVSVGGITGGGPGAVSDCYNVGTVTGDSHVGGIAGSGAAENKCFSWGRRAGALRNLLTARCWRR